MTLILLLVWWLVGHSTVALAHPWSGWFIALFLCAFADLN